MEYIFIKQNPHIPAKLSNKSFGVWLNSCLHTVPWSPKAYNAAQISVSTRTCLLECILIFEGDTDPTPKNSKEITTILVLYSSFTALSILLVGKKYRTVATQCFFGKAKLPTL